MNRLISSATRIGFGGASIVAGTYLMYEGFPVVVEGLNETRQNSSENSQILVGDRVDGAEFIEGGLVTMAGAVLTITGVVIASQVSQKPRHK